MPRSQIAPATAGLRFQTSRPSAVGLLPTVQSAVSGSPGVLKGHAHWRVAATHGPESVATEREATSEVGKKAASAMGSIFVR